MTIRSGEPWITLSYFFGCCVLFCILQQGVTATFPPLLATTGRSGTNSGQISALWSIDPFTGTSNIIVAKLMIGGTEISVSGMALDRTNTVAGDNGILYMVTADNNTPLANYLVRFDITGSTSGGFTVTNGMVVGPLQAQDVRGLASSYNGQLYGFHFPTKTVVRIDTLVFPGQASFFEFRIPLDDNVKSVGMAFSREDDGPSNEVLHLVSDAGVWYTVDISSGAGSLQPDSMGALSSLVGSSNSCYGGSINPNDPNEFWCPIGPNGRRIARAQLNPEEEPPQSSLATTTLSAAGLNSRITSLAFTFRITQAPSSSPSGMPSSDPSSQPSKVPSSQPSSQPSSLPSMAPSSIPSSTPSSMPSSLPSAAPSSLPSSLPSVAPSGMPSAMPSSMPSGMPSAMPSSGPSTSRAPSTSPSVSPTSIPSLEPSVSPSRVPSVEPSQPPTATPTVDPCNINQCSINFILFEFPGLRVHTDIFGACVESCLLAPLSFVFDILLGWDCGGCPP